MSQQNLLKKALNGIIGKGIGNELPRLNGSTFYQIGSFFGYSFGSTDLKDFLKAYSSNPLVYMIVNKIATTTAGIDRVYVNQSGEEVTNSDLEIIMNSPNAEQGQQEFLEECYEYFNTTGNVFILIVIGEGVGAELRCLNSGRMRLTLNGLGEPAFWTYTDNLSNEHRYELEDILHIKTSNVVQATGADVYFGLSPLESAWMIIKSSNEIFEAEASIFKNRGIIGVLTNDTDTPMLPDEQKATQDQFNSETGGAGRFNQLRVTNTRLRYLQTGMSPSDLKLLEGIMNKLRLLCSIYGLSSVLFNDNDNSTYNNVSEAEKASYNNVFIPLGNKFDKAISKFLQDRLGFSDMMKIDLTSIEVVKASTNEVALALNNMSPLLANNVIANLTVDEIRELAGLESLPNGVGNVLPVQVEQPSVTVTQ